MRNVAEEAARHREVVAVMASIAISAMPVGTRVAVSLISKQKRGSKADADWKILAVRLLEAVGFASD